MEEDLEHKRVRARERESEGSQMSDLVNQGDDDAAAFC